MRLKIAIKYEHELVNYNRTYRLALQELKHGIKNERVVLLQDQVMFSSDKFGTRMTLKAFNSV